MKDEIHIYSHNTGWLNGKTCEDCRGLFDSTVEFRMNGEYTNLCKNCFDKIKVNKNER